MSAWIKIAIRNLFKNGRRSLYTIVAIALGIAAVNVFGGYTAYMYTSLQDSYIYVQSNGHLTVFKKGSLEEGKLDPIKYLIGEDTLNAVSELCKNDPRILVVTPKLEISGLVSNGKVSSIFYAEARVPSDATLIRSKGTGMISRLKLFDGQNLADDVPSAVGMSSGLARKLDLKIGAGGNVMAPTVDGMVNALDFNVCQTFESAMAEMNDKLMNMNLRFAQSLYDTTSVGSITILLADTGLTNLMKRHLQEVFQQKGLDVEVKTWEEMSPFYCKVRDMFNVIFLFVFLIVLVIVVMSVVNTISMSVLERTREIGTLRALGLKRLGIVKLFAIESFLMGIVGSMIGLTITLGVWYAIKVIQPTWVPPQMTRSVPLEVFLVPNYIAESLLFLIMLSAVAATVPARKAAYGTSIVDALGHI